MSISITTNETIPARSRIFSPETVKQVLAYLKGEAEGQNGEPVQNLGFGTFGSANAARSAGATLNTLLVDAGAPHKYSVTTVERGPDQFTGVLLNRAAKVASPEAVAKAAATRAKSAKAKGSK